MRGRSCNRPASCGVRVFPRLLLRAVQGGGGVREEGAGPKHACKRQRVPNVKRHHMHSVEMASVLHQITSNAALCKRGAGAAGRRGARLRVW